MQIRDFVKPEQCLSHTRLLITQIRLTQLIHSTWICRTDISLLLSYCNLQIHLRQITAWKNMNSGLISNQQATFENETLSLYAFEGFNHYINICISFFGMHFISKSPNPTKKVSINHLSKWHQTVKGKNQSINLLKPQKIKWKMWK